MNFSKMPTKESGKGILQGNIYKTLQTSVDFYRTQKLHFNKIKNLPFFNCSYLRSIYEEIIEFWYPFILKKNRVSVSINLGILRFLGRILGN